MRAIADVRVIAARPHPTGSAANDAVRAHLVARLQALGFRVREQPFALTPKQTARLAKRGSAPATHGVNLIAVRPAESTGEADEQPAVALMAHYDSVTGSPQYSVILRAKIWDITEQFPETIGSIQKDATASNSNPNLARVNAVQQAAQRTGEEMLSRLSAEGVR